MYIYIYEPLGLVRFATESLSQRPLRDLCSLVFGATRLKETTKKTHLRSAYLNTPLVFGIKLILLFLKFVYFMKTSTITIHIRKLLMRNSESAYLFTFINIWKHVSRFILNFHQFVYFMFNNNKHSHQKFLNAQFGFSILGYLY